MLFIKIFVLCLVIEEDNAEARDKPSGSCSGKLIFDILKLFRNSVKNVLRKSGSSDFDTLGGQEIGFFSFTFPTNLLAQPFIRVSSVITMLHTNYVCYKLLPIRSFCAVHEAHYYLHTHGLGMFSGNLVLHHRYYEYYFP